MSILESDSRRADVPASLYHATFEHHLPSIMKHGLGGAKSKRNFDVSRGGVIYLSDDPDTASEYASNSQFVTMGEVVVLKIDVSQLDHSRLHQDENDEGEYGGNSYEYHGVIAPSALTHT